MAASPRPVSLTGIKPSGIPHLGNYVGAIRPAMELVDEPTTPSTSSPTTTRSPAVRDPVELDEYTRAVTAVLARLRPRPGGQ